MIETNQPINQRHDPIVVLFVLSVHQVVTILSVLTNLAVGVVVGVVISSLCHVWVSGMSLNAKATTILEREGNRHKVGR